MATQRASAQLRESYRQPILRAVGYDENKVDRLVAMERAVMPHAGEEELHRAAYERWLKDSIERPI